MGLPNVYSLAGFTLMTLLLLHCVNTQDTQSYYFVSPNGQTRFVPSSSVQASRQPTQAAYLSGSRAAGAGAGAGAYSQPGSYQDQLLFISNDSKQQQQALAKPLTSAAYSPFGTQISQTRNPEYYDISPRPFGVPSTAATGGFTRSKAIRTPSSGGFVPQQQSIRANVPHQQTQFLAHFNEPNSSAAHRPSINSLGGSASRPFSNGGFVPSRSRPSAASYNSDLALAAQTQPQQTSFKSTRNRFQPSSATSTTNAAVSGTTETTLSTSGKRFNRYGAGRTTSTKPQPQQTAAQSTSLAESISSAQPQRPSYGRTSNKSNGVRGFTPRRPVFISREINEPVNLTKLQRPFGANSGRVKYDKEAVLKQQVAATSAAFKPSQLLSVGNSDAESEEYEEDKSENSAATDDAQDGDLEKLELHEADETTTLAPANTTPTSISDTTISSDEEDITTSSEEAVNEAMTKSGKKVVGGVVAPNSSNGTSEYDYEYAEEDETTEATVKEAKAQNTTRKMEETTASVHSTESPGITTESPRTTANEEEEEPKVDVLTTALSESTTEALAKEDDSPEETQYESSTDYDEEEYEEEEESEGEDASKVTISTQAAGKGSREREVVSVVTTKSVVNGSTAFPSPVTPSSTSLSSDEEAIFKENNMRPALDEMTETENSADDDASNDQSVSNTTESYVVIASIQTSRSINGARFLPFPAIEQEETKQTLSELERKIHSQKSASLKNAEDSSSEEPTNSAEETNEKTSTSGIASSTESIIDKLDRVQSELSSGLLSGKYPIITEMDVSTQATTTTSGSKFVPNIRKFQPKTTAASKVKVHHFDESEMDELAGLLPAGFKPRASYKNRKITTSTTTTTQAPEFEAEEVKKPTRNSTISRSFKNNAVPIQDVALSGLLPKGYKLSTTTEASKSDVKDILSKLKFDDDLDKLLPKDYKEKANSTAKPAVTVVDDISKFLPPGYKLTTTSTTKKPVVVIHDDIKQFLPPGYKPKDEDDDSDKPAGEIVALKADDISKFLPPGYKLNSTAKSSLPEPEAIDISQLLPKDYKPSATKDHNEGSAPKKITFKEVASNAGKPDETVNTETTLVAATSTSTEKQLDAATTSATGFKVVFPKGIHKRIGSQRLTTPRTHETAEGGGNSPPVVIKKGPPTRATTEFTGWPTPSTTPISIEKLLEQARTVSINFEDLLSTSSTSTSTTSTTTTTTTTPRPTKPGHCTSDCDLAATIKIIDGVAWKPELLDHNTLEWKNLAREIEAELNEVYSNAPQLRNWYKKVRIDSFSKGSVLVDYYVELANITKDVNTLEIKKLFHEALTQAPVESTLPHKPEIENETDNDADAENQPFEEVKEEKLVKETFLMGKYIIDPTATDFSVIPKSLSPTVEYAEEDLLIPQWAIVVIVIGVGSLIFVIIFGVTVLLNKQKRSKKTPVPLTNDMLNELKINHMGGADNYGVDDFYNIDDAWNDTKQPIKPKRFTNSMQGSNGSNIYDSWRSTRHGDYFYDSQKGDSLQRPHHQHQHQTPQPQHHHQHQHQQPYAQGYGHQYPDAFADAHQMYTYNNHASRTRYPRDYDPDF